MLLSEYLRHSTTYRKENYGHFLYFGIPVFPQAQTAIALCKTMVLSTYINHGNNDTAYLIQINTVIYYIYFRLS
jgi:hypothetical protein